MYREHLLSIEHVQKLLYHQVDSGQNGRQSLRAPPFFISQTDKGLKGEFFPAGSEAERRISFLAQSLTTSIPELLPDQIIYVNYHPTIETRRSNFRHRPIGIGSTGTRWYVYSYMSAIRFTETQYTDLRDNLPWSARSLVRPCGGEGFVWDMDRKLGWAGTSAVKSHVIFCLAITKHIQAHSSCFSTLRIH